MCGSPLQHRYSSIVAYLEKDADVGVPIDHHEYFIKLGKTFAERVARFMQYEEAYRKRYSLVVEWV
jgi:hypothetical protein